LTKINHLKEIAKSNKAFIIYKSDKGFDLYTDFSKKIILTNKNIKNFINKATKFKFKKKETDIFIGFFGYEILNNLIGIKLKKQKGLKFPKGIFYKPETKVKLQNKLDYKNLKLTKSNKYFKININKASYKVIFD
jgi:para-aminobenzoate synthetase component 1